ncbi:unnamed protein product [Brassica napus]|uniref:(rape) hypothetical protein n=1 Tax=Brassica napus TaxID=3708 RepID=A0A816ZGA9_BRANA|nr:unnamed protein product [Brassica napus]
MKIIPLILIFTIIVLTSFPVSIKVAEAAPVPPACKGKGPCIMNIITGAPAPKGCCMQYKQNNAQACLQSITNSKDVEINKQFVGASGYLQKDRHGLMHTIFSLEEKDQDSRGHVYSFGIAA